MPKKKEKPFDPNDIFKEIGTKLKQLAVSPNANSYKPHAKQELFHRATESVRLYIGGNRSGKTVGGIMEDIWWLTGRHPYMQTPDPNLREIRGRLISVDFLSGIKQIIIPMLMQWVPPSELLGGSWYTAYSEGERVLYFENGSELELKSYDQDLGKFAGTSRDFIHYDEEPPRDIYIESQMRLIDRKGKSWVTMTPVEGMTWMYDTIYLPGTLNESDRISVIEVDIHENPYLDEQTIKATLEDLTEDERDAREKGKFVQVGGLIYKKFDPKIHVIPQMDFSEFVDPLKYQIYMSHDHGLSNPTAVLWHAVNQQGEIITFDEHYEAGKIIPYHAAVIHSRNLLHKRIPDVNVTDPACAQRNPLTGTSIQTEYAIRGIGFILGTNDVVAGIGKVSQYIHVRPNGTPTWRVTRNCANLIKEIQRYRWATWASKKQQYNNNPHEKPHKKDDHAMDSLRYFMGLRPDLKHDSIVESEFPPETVQTYMGNAGVLAHPWRKVDPNFDAEYLAERESRFHEIDLGE